MRETIAYRTLDHLRGELAQIQTQCPSPAEAEALQAALAGFEHADPPPMRDPARIREWRARIHMRDVYEAVDHYSEDSAVASVCRTAVGRLSACQNAVVEGCFFQQTSVPDLATRRSVSPSTIYNTKLHAQAGCTPTTASSPRSTDSRRPRPRPCARAGRALPPDGRLPDCRRVVHIDHAA